MRPKNIDKFCQISFHSLLELTEGCLQMTLIVTIIVYNLEIILV